MASPKFPYSTYIDRVITDENHNIIFGEKPGNVLDKVNDMNQKEMIKQMLEQIKNQQAQINRQDSMLQNQTEQLAKQDTQIQKQDNMISVLNDAVAYLQTIVDNQADEKETNDALLAMQDTILSRLDGEFNVMVNGNKLELYGVSTDTKPTNVMIGTTFTETDTGNSYIYSGVRWVLL